MRDSILGNIKTIKVLTLLIVSGLLLWKAPSMVMLAGLVLFALLCSVAATLEYRWRMFTSNTPDARAAIRFPTPGEPNNTDRSLTLILPAWQEEDVIGHTLEILAQQNYDSRKFEVLVTLRREDHATIAEAQRVADLHPNLIRVFVNDYEPGDNKSTQMNRVLGEARGQYVAPIDAEDIVAKDLLRHVNALLIETDADVLQGGVQLTNLDTSHKDDPWLTQVSRFIKGGWFAVHNVMEYRFWFSSRMFYQQKLGFVPLGGNTVFIRTNLLKEVGGWNEKCLTEDAHLGVNLSVNHNAKIVAAYTPELSTQEHTPPRIFGKGGMFNQRVRWDQGFWQVWRERQWRKLPTLKQRILASYILLTPLLQALNGIMLPISIAAAILVKAPVPLAMLMFIPFLPMVLTVASQLIELRDFSKEFGIKAKPRHYLSLIIGFFPYQFLLGMAALKGVARESAGIRDWSKTARNKQLHSHTQVPVSGTREARKATA